MKQIIFLSLVLLILLCIINNEGVLAIYGSDLMALSLTDPRLQPQKYCDSSKCTPTIHTMPKTKIDYQKDANTIYKAFRGEKDKDNTIIILLTRIASVQRLELAQIYGKEGGRNLPGTLRELAQGRYEESIIAVITPLPHFYAEVIQKSILTAGPVDPILVEIFCTVNNFGIKSIGEFYMILFKKSLEKDIAGKVTGTFKNVMVSLIQGKRVKEANVDNQKAAADAKALNGPGAKPWKLKPTFTEIFGTRSNSHLRQVFTEYKKTSGREIEDDIKKEFPVPEGTGLLEMTKCIRSKVKFLADKLEEGMRHKSGPAMDGPLIRILVSRSEIDLEDIKKEYNNIYKKTLEKAVADRIGSEYRRILTNMIRGNAVEALPPPGK